MKKIVFVPIFVGIIVILSLLSFYMASKSGDGSATLPDVDFIYFDIDDIQEVVVTRQMTLSTPIPITDHTIDQYCSFFDAQNIKRSVSYCLTSAIVNSDGTPLGNLNMGGNPILPIMALAIIEVPSLDLRQEETAFVFETMIEILVCECWSEQRPGGYASVSEWLDAAKEQYNTSPQSTLKSKIDGLAHKRLVLEIMPAEESYLFTLTITK